MFWKRKNNESQGQKLSGPKEIPEIVKKHLDQGKIDPDVVQFLKILVKNNNKGERTFDFRIFDPADAEARDLKVVNFNSLDELPGMIICDGSYDELAKTATINLRKSVPKPALLNRDQVLVRLETLNKPGDQVFFFAAAGGGSGGPLGRGATVVKINPVDGPKKRKKFGVYSSSVVDMLPVPAKEGLVYDTDNLKDLSQWIADTQKERFC